MKDQKSLSPELIEFLQGEKVISLITTDAETGRPNLDVISWLVASEDGEKIKFAVGHKASSARNIEKNPDVILGVIGTEGCFAIKGTGIVSDVIEGIMKWRVVSVVIHSIEDVMFYGGKITVTPEYTKTYNQELAIKLDEQIYSILRQA